MDKTYSGVCPLDETVQWMKANYDLRYRKPDEVIESVPYRVWTIRNIESSCSSNPHCRMKCPIYDAVEEEIPCL